MAYYIAVFDWSLYSTSLSTSDLENSTHGNDPGQTGSNPYASGSPTWTGVDFTYTGGSSSLLQISDDDGIFEDGYVETGGSQTLAADITINGVDYFAGDVVENEFSLIDSNGLEVWVVRINGVNVGFAYPQADPPAVNDVFNADDTRDGDGADSLDQTTPSEEAYANILCFAAGTAIETDKGARAVETLTPGDLVRTLDDGLQPVRLVTRTDYKWPSDCAHHKPILFRAGSLGAGLPRRDLIVSAQHRMLMPDEHGGHRLCPARAMAVLRTVRHMRGLRRATLIHLLFDRHQIIFAEGAPTESFYPGSLAMRTLAADQRRDVLAAIPCALQDYATNRTFLKVQEAEDILFDRNECWTEQSIEALLTAMKNESRGAVKPRAFA